MFTFLEQAFALNSAGWFILSILTLTGYVLIYQMLEDHGAALIGTPLMILGAAFGQYGLKMFGIAMAHDKTVNMGIGMAIGMFASAIVIVGVLWLWGKALNR